MIKPFKTNNNLTVTGNISTSNLFYDISGNSSQWNNAYKNQSKYLPLSGGTMTGGISGNNLIIQSNSGPLVLKTASDVYGPVTAMIVNENGMNGMIITNEGLPLSEIVVKGNDGQQMNFRMEARGDYLQNGNSQELQILNNDGDFLTTYGSQTITIGANNTNINVGVGKVPDSGYSLDVIGSIRSTTYYGSSGINVTNSGYTGFGGNKGFLFLNGGSGFSNSGGDTNQGGNSGYINLSGGLATADNQGGNGGNIIMVGSQGAGNGTRGDAGYINTSGCYNTNSTYSACGGYINTSAGDYGSGGKIDTSNNGGYICTTGGYDGGGYIYTGAGGYINTSGGGGNIDTTQGGSIITGGSINTSSSGSYLGGYIDTRPDNDNNGGYINTCGGGFIDTSNGGTSGAYGGSINTSCAGGSINTSCLGGSINTTSGYIQLGKVVGSYAIWTTLSANPTTLRQINLPDNSGTIALLSDTTNYLPLSGGTITGATRINSNLTVTGNISAQGTAYFTNTLFTTTSALCAIANSSGPALYIGQKGSGDLASFYDLSPTPVEVLHVGASVGIPGVGIYTSTPNKELTVVGDISATKNFYDSVGNSSQWNNVYSTVKSNSATTWNYQGTDVKALTGNWQNTYTNFSVQSANNLSVYSLINSTSATTFNVNNLTVVGSINATGYISASALKISTSATTFTNPVTASGTFLIVNVNGSNKAIQLWDYTS